MLIRNNPWQLLNDLNVLWDGNLARSRTPDDSKVESSRWIPAVDIKEEADKFILSVDIPGVDPQKVEISMENNVLAVKGVRDETNIDQGDNFHRIERIKGSFYRRFTLPDTADAEQITANAKNGVLDIVIGKKKALKARKIEVTAD